MTKRTLTRRQFFAQTGAFGIASTALATLLNDKMSAQQHADYILPGVPKAKRVIFLSMIGAPSQLDLFDQKPKLLEYDGKPVPESLIKGDRFAFIRGIPNLQRYFWEFQQHGQSGATISSLMPHLAEVADDVAFVKSMYATQFNHGPAQIFMNTGFQIIGRPSFGSWLSYGIGSDARELPAFVVLLSGESQPDGGTACWSSGFLPTQHQGVQLRKQGDAVLFLSNPEGISAQSNRRNLDLIRELDQEHLTAVDDPEIATRIAAYEMSYKMQTSVPELQDLAKEPAHIHEMYGTTPGQPSFANNCLLARRLVERGVRFVQLFHRGWDHHGISFNTDIVNKLPVMCKQTDQASAALIKDLKQRGLLDDTLVIWGGEFGRTPMAEQRTFVGRDHNPKAFTMWMAGGGIKPGTTLGRTDDFGYTIVEDPMSVHDLHATALHLLGIDHTKLTYKFQGRNFRLTDVEGSVVTKLLA
jgi:uncharacterized protein DUF1501